MTTIQLLVNDLTMAYTTRPLRPGVYVPLPTFFDENQEIDFDSYRRHLLGKIGLIFEDTLVI